MFQENPWVWPGKALDWFMELELPYSEPAPLPSPKIRECWVGLVILPQHSQIEPIRERNWEVGEVGKGSAWDSGIPPIWAFQAFSSPTAGFGTTQGWDYPRHSDLEEFLHFPVLRGNLGLESQHPLGELSKESAQSSLGAALPKVSILEFLVGKQGSIPCPPSPPSPSFPSPPYPI